MLGNNHPTLSSGRGRGGRGRSGRGGYRGQKHRQQHHPARFTGASTKMLGHVFQVNGEQRTRGQFKDTLDMLRIYASENFPKDVKKMEILFGTNITTPVIEEPKEPEVKKGNTVLTKAQEKIYDAKIALYIKEEKSMDDALTSLFNITWGQRSLMMQNRLESLSDYERIRIQADLAQLLKEIRKVSNKLEVSANVYDALDEAKRKYFAYYQQNEESNMRHVKNIKDLVATIEHYGGSICDDKGLIKHEKKKDGGASTARDYNAIVRAKVLGCTVVKCANDYRYKELIKNLRTQYSYGQDLYPNSVEMAHDMLNKHKILNRQRRKLPYKKIQNNDEGEENESTR